MLSLGNYFLIIHLSCNNNNVDIHLHSLSLQSHKLALYITLQIWIINQLIVVLFHDQNCRGKLSSGCKGIYNVHVPNNWKHPYVWKFDNTMKMQYRPYLYSLYFYSILGPACFKLSQSCPKVIFLALLYICHDG